MANNHVVKRKFDDLLTGKEVERKATVILPFDKELEVAVKETTPERLLQILRGKAEDVIYWALYGFKLAAFNQVRNSLQGFDSDDETIMDLYSSCMNAVKSITAADPENTEMRKAAVTFILSQPAYADLKAELEESAAANKDGGEIVVDFNTVEVKKPGKRGRQKKEKAEDTATASAQKSAQKSKRSK